jgi:hypothetical protein
MLTKQMFQMLLFWFNRKEWREANTNLKGNMRDYANISELICLSNLENLNAVWISENITQQERLIKLNQIAIQQLTILQEISNLKVIKDE